MLLVEFDSQIEHQPAVQDPISEASEHEDEPDDQGNESEPEQAPSDASTDELCLKASSAQNTWPSNWTQAMKRSDAEE